MKRFIRVTSLFCIGMASGMVGEKIGLTDFNIFMASGYFTLWFLPAYFIDEVMR